MDYPEKYMQAKHDERCFRAFMKWKWSQSLLPGNQRQDAYEYHKAAPGEVQTRYQENFPVLDHSHSKEQAS